MKTIRNFHLVTFSKDLPNLSANKYVEAISQSIAKSASDGFEFDVRYEEMERTWEDVFSRLEGTDKIALLRIIGLDSCQFTSNVFSPKDGWDRHLKFIIEMQKKFPNLVYEAENNDFVVFETQKILLNNSTDIMIAASENYNPNQHIGTPDFIYYPEIIYQEWMKSRLRDYIEKITAFLKSRRSVIVGTTDKSRGCSSLLGLSNLLEDPSLLETLYVCSSNPSDVRRLMRTPR